jgi:hypothetical protein
MFKFLRPIQRYFFPPRGLHRIPKHISADYARHDVNVHQRLVMMAGLARDPARAQHIYDEMVSEYGLDDTRRRLELQVKRNRPGTFGERLLKLLRRIFGENERLNTRPPRPDDRVQMRYKFDNSYQRMDQR